MTKIAIVFDDPNIEGQTFVQYHIAKLFGGKTVIITRKKSNLPSIGKPHLVYPKVSGGFPRAIFNGFSKARRSKVFREFIEQNDVGYILAEFGYSGLLVYEDATRLKLPTYVYFRGADASSWLNSAKYVRRLRAMMGKIDGVFAVSQSLLDSLHAHGIAHANEHVVPSGVDTSAFAPGNKDPNLIASVGRFIGKKGHKISIGAFSRACASYPDLRLEIVGDGELLEACKQQAEGRGISHRVIFHGAKNHDFVRDLLARSSIYLQHSVTDSRSETEGIPTALQEAMSCGNAVISTLHAGIPEHVSDGENGLLVNENDREAYVEKLQLLLRDDKLRTRLGANARAYAIERLDKRISIDLIEAIMTGGGAGAES